MFSEILNRVHAIYCKLKKHAEAFSTFSEKSTASDTAILSKLDEVMAKEVNGGCEGVAELQTAVQEIGGKTDAVNQALTETQTSVTDGFAQVQATLTEMKEAQAECCAGKPIGEWKENV